MLQLELASIPFVSQLPQRLLAQGALAFVGHVERAWFYSYGWPGSGQHTETFQSTLRAILSGQPIGNALEDFQYRYLDINNEFAEKHLIQDINLQEDVGAEAARLWTARNDARSYILLGDPLVRLRSESMAEV